MAISSTTINSLTQKKSDKNIKVDKVQDFNAKKLGDQTLKVTFSNGDKTIEKEIKVTVKDTKKPEIVLKKDNVTITAGDKLDLKDNVKSVKDPIDGTLKYSDKETKKSGYYIDKGKLNTKKAGTYEVIVKAFDVNGNKTEKKFKVIVKEKEKATTEGQKSEAAQNNNNAGQRSETSSPSTGNQNAGTSGGQGEAALRIPEAPTVPMEHRVPLLPRQSRQHLLQHLQLRISHMMVESKVYLSLCNHRYLTHKRKQIIGRLKYIIRPMKIVLILG